MKKIIISILFALPFSMFSSTVVILECKLLDDGTIEDVKKINSEINSLYRDIFQVKLPIV